MSLLVGEALSFFGCVADHAAGICADESARVRKAASGLGRLAQLPHAELDALEIAALLRNAGAFSGCNEDDRPAEGARVCAQIERLPSEVADIVRWQREYWDGTGSPDHLRWTAIPFACHLLHIAARFAQYDDREQARAAICYESGRTFAPDAAAVFIAWYYGDAQQALATRPRVPDDVSVSPRSVLRVLAEQVDRLADTPGHTQRLAAGCRDRAHGAAEEGVEEMEIAAYVHRAGEPGALLLDAFPNLRALAERFATQA